MKPERLIAAAAALVGCAVACGVYISRYPDPDRSPTTPLLKSKPSGEKHHASLASQFQSRSRPSERPAQKRPTQIAEKSSPLARLIAGTPPSGRGAILSESRWRANAAQVERESNHELARLTNLLDLDGQQQSQVFSALARNSPYWLPGMQAGEKSQTGALKTSAPASAQLHSGLDTSTLAAPVGAPGASTGSGLPEVAALLDADQQQTLVQDEMDRQAWWEEVLPQLLPPSLAGDSTAPAIIKEFDGEGGGVLIEE